MLRRLSRRTPAAGFVVILAASLLAAAFVGGMALAASQTPDSIAAVGAPSTAPVTQVPFRDERPVDVRIELSQSTPAVVATTGRVTGWQCVTGEQPQSGGLEIEIDSSRVALLATERPLWRDFDAAATGQDVQDFNAALAALGYPTSGNTVTQATFTAVADLLGRPDIASGQATIPFASFIWISGAGVVTDCTSSLGLFVDAGESVAMLASPPALQFEVPTDLVPGGRFLRIDGEDLALDSDQNVIDAAQLGNLPSVRAALAEGAPSIDSSGTLALAAESDAYALPATALIGQTNYSACVMSGSEFFDVEVLGSQLGQSYVSFISDDAPTSVEIGAERPPACP